MTTRRRWFSASLVLLALAGCRQESAGTGQPAADSNPASAAKSGQPAADKQSNTPEVPGVSREKWGEVDGQEVDLYTLKNKNGLVAKITNWGATVTELSVPDKEGKLDDVVLGFATLDGYLKGDGKKANPAYFGGIIGRYCNRIGGAAFAIDGKKYELEKNNGANHLHGGPKGFDKCVWQAEPVARDEGPAVRFTLRSPDGDEGYPGEVEARVTYVLTNDNALRIEMEATTDKPTPVSLTNHAYFNLSGDGRGTILDHRLKLAADRHTPLDAGGIPTGKLETVKDTPLDFTTETRIGERIDKLSGEPGGYDHNLVLADKKSVEPRPAATVHEPKTGRTLDIDTTEVGLQFYTGNYLDGTLAGKRGKYAKHAGLCLEPQFFPDSPNQPEFPSPILKPGETYRQVTVYRFGVRK